MSPATPNDLALDSRWTDLGTHESMSNGRAPCAMRSSTFMSISFRAATYACRVVRQASMIMCYPAWGQLG